MKGTGDFGKMSGSELADGGPGDGGGEGELSTSGGETLCDGVAAFLDLVVVALMIVCGWQLRGLLSS